MSLPDWLKRFMISKGIIQDVVRVSTEEDESGDLITYTISDEEQTWRLRVERFFDEHSNRH